jgi:hypothetical protein
VAPIVQLLSGWGPLYDRLFGVLRFAQPPWAYPRQSPAAADPKGLFQPAAGLSRVVV